MSFLTGFKLTRDDYPSQAEWIERLLRPLNLFSQSAVNAVNGGLVVSQNVMAMYKTARVKMPPVPWQNLTPENSTQTVGEPPLSYIVRPCGCIDLRGAVAPTTKADGTVIFTLPNASLYPEFTETLPLIHDHGSSHSYCKISHTDGKLRIYKLSSSATNIFFNSVTFYAKNPPAPMAYMGPDWPIKLATDMPLPVKACFAAQCTDVDTNEKLSNGLGGVEWESTRRGEIQVKRVEGLTPNRSYDITFLMFGG
jgi:hypothetical protein